MIPLVLVNSYGKEKGRDIIKDICAANGDISDPATIQFKNCEIEAYKLNIITKYYKTQIALITWEDINSIPSAVLSNIEGCIFYFDPDNKSFVLELNALKKFVENSKIEAPCLITRNFSEKNATYSMVKTLSSSSPFIIIDLNDDDEGPGNGYGEVIELLRNNVWSSVHDSRLNCIKNQSKLETCNFDDDSEIDDTVAESQLNEFEDLLNSIQQFKIMSQNLNREDVLNNAEKLAEHFAKILSED